MAEKISNHLLTNKLAACINIIENAISMYRWKGSIVKEKEKNLPFLRQVFRVHNPYPSIKYGKKK